MSNITPNEILEKDFKKKLNGYDPLEVREFLENIASFLTSLIKENNLLKSRVVTQKAQIEAYIKKEAELMNALVTAQKFSDDLKGQAEKEADFILQRAKLEAESLIIDAKKEYETIIKNARFDSEKIVRDANRRVINLEARITELKRLREEYIFKLRSTLDWFNRMLQQEERDAKSDEIDISESYDLIPSEKDSDTFYSDAELDSQPEEQNGGVEAEVSESKVENNNITKLDEIDDSEIISWFEPSDENGKKSLKD